MTIFAILLPEPQDGLVEQIKAAFPDDYHKLSATQFLVSSRSVNPVEISRAIKVYDPEKPEADSLGNAVVFSTSAYYGKAPPELWDWLKDKLEARQSG